MNDPTGRCTIKFIIICTNKSEYKSAFTKKNMKVHQIFTEDIYFPDNAGGDLHIGRYHLSHACFNLPVQVIFSKMNSSCPATKSIYQFPNLWANHFQQSAHSTCCSDSGQLVRCHGNFEFKKSHFAILKWSKFRSLTICYGSALQGIHHFTAYGVVFCKPWYWNLTIWPSAHLPILYFFWQS